MKKEFINEINHYRNLMGLEPLNEFVFKDNVVDGYAGINSTPSDDKIDSALLRDIKKAEEISGIKACITTAVDGHKPKGRHKVGHAVDIAMFGNKNGVCTGYSSKDAAKKNGIYDSIIKFTDALQTLGYKFNSADMSKDKGICGGDVKNIFSFGYAGHDNHVHVSNIENYNCGEGKSGTTSREVKKTESPSMEAQVRAHAKSCGWGDDIQGFMDSGKQCPKPGTTTTPTKTSTGEILKQPAGDPYEYKKTPDGKYYTKKKTSSSWINITGTKFETPIRQKVFKDL
jgi:hypothetical protein